jgi:hypothetical protein
VRRTSAGRSRIRSGNCGRPIAKDNRQRGTDKQKRWVVMRVDWSGLRRCASYQMEQFVIHGTLHSIDASDVTRE